MGGGGGEEREILGEVVKELGTFKWYREISYNGKRIEQTMLP